MGLPEPVQNPVEQKAQPPSTSHLRAIDTIPIDPYQADGPLRDQTSLKRGFSLDKFWTNHSESFFAIVMAVFSASLAIVNLVNSRNSSESSGLANDKNNMFMWYQAKGIKENVTESRRDFIDTLIKAGSINKSERKLFAGQIIHLNQGLDRYKREKREILLGSNTIGKKNWILEVDGKLGQVQGVKEIEKQLTVDSLAQNKFSMASLVLQLALVFGAIGILVKQFSLKTFSATILFTLGTIGITFFIQGYLFLL